MSAEKRFTKGKLIAHLEHRIISLQREHGFDPSNGWVQVKGRGEDRNRDYGQYSTLKDLLSRVRNNWL